MARYRFKIYYEYSGPTKSEPLRNELPDHEIERALNDFPGGLEHYLGDPDGRVIVDAADSSTNSVWVSVFTELSEIEVKDAVERCLRDFGLYGKAEPPE